MSLSSCVAAPFSTEAFSTDYVSSEAALNVDAEVNLSQVITDILATGSISRGNQAYLFNLMKSRVVLSSRDVALINRVFQRLQMGLVRVTSD